MLCLKEIFIAIIFSLLISCNCSYHEYGNANGTIIDINKNNYYTTIIRKHIQRLVIGTSARKENKLVYSDPYIDSNTIVDTLTEGDYIDVYEALSRRNLKEDTVDVFLRIERLSGSVGWIFFNKYDPYDKDTWQIVREYTFKNRNWRARKLFQQMSVIEKVSIYDKPGIEGAKIINEYLPGIGDFVINTLEIVDEKDYVDDIYDHWVKIETRDKKIGWIFGGSTRIERGGPKYLTPDAVIAFALGYY